MMRYILKSLVLYFSAILGGFAMMSMILPTIVQIAGMLPPQGSDASLWFIYGFGFCMMMVFIAANIAALFGFFMMSNRGLRRATLTLPVWATASYGVAYLLIMNF